MGHIPMQTMEHAPMEHTPLASQVPMEQAPMEQTQMQQTMEQAQIEQAPLEQQPSTTPGPSASSESDTNNEKNPWAVASIYDFNYFCCPDCDHRTQDKQQFVVHAAFFHARDFQTTQSTVVDGSLGDVDIPKIDPSVFENEINDPTPSDYVKVEQFEDEEGDDDPDYDFFAEYKERTERKQKKSTKVKSEPNFKIKDEPEGALAGPSTSWMIDDDDFLRPPESLSSGIKKFPCLACDLEFETIGPLKTHARKAHGSWSRHPYPCPECGVDCLFLKTLKRHLLRFHGVNPKKKEKPGNSMCTICGKNLQVKYLAKHEREQHGIDRRAHLRPIDPLIPKCAKCEKEFENSIMLNEHSKECEGPSKEFPCPQCDLKWANGPILNFHLRKDHGVEEVHTCDICGKCLKRKISIRVHIKVEHDGTKDQVCHICGKGFVRKDGLKLHLRNFHERSGKYQCTYCDYRTSLKDRLEVHINQVHTKAIRFDCEHCDFFSYRKQGLRDHVKIVHLKVKPHVCQMCGKAFVRPKELENHQKRAGHC